MRGSVVSLRCYAVIVVAMAAQPAYTWVVTPNSIRMSTFGKRHHSVEAGAPRRSAPVGSIASSWTSCGTGRRQRQAEAHTAGSSRGGVRMQVWSNPQAVQDYQDLLDGKAPEEKTDGPSVIIGGGKLGTALKNMGMGEDVVLGRGEGIPNTLPATSGRGEGGEEGGVLEEFPIYVCVPEDEVAGIIDSCPQEKKQDLVFLQSGCLEPLLKSRGLCRPEQTQATLFFDIKQIGARPRDRLTNIGVDGRGEPKYAAQTAVCGKWSGALAQRLENSEYDLQCTKVFYLDWRRVMFEKLVFECAVNLVGALHNFETVGFIVKYHGEEVVDMMFELKNTLRGTLAVTLLNGYPERLLAYGEAAGERKTHLDANDFKWYNKFFWDISRMATNKKFDDPCAMHTEYLEYGREKGILAFDD